MQEMIRIFESANNQFILKEDKFIFSEVAERALCGSLMMYLRKEIDKTSYSKYYVDVEYNRNKGKIKTIIDGDMKVVTINCDLIVHSRGDIPKQDNLIALEMKKSRASAREKEKDRIRLISLTKDSFDNVWSFDGQTLPDHVCRYKLGIYYEINILKRLLRIEYYNRGKKINEIIQRVPEIK